ncbi:putative -dichlorophenol 6-monooxygenase protein [Neofusicoccum parvum UCRNP2]|uniref:Putative-dichlorophenol 6-monooxygenase protein n=1 Tax=Botryosphaeria parva (strain UCR-NP2) TaxID=1287680 RepID=R1E773_BOTPV|nr:putative -dichlorophenol 6-monooxygenase protein [Neofusicoccum parvum UCRNP2]
MAALECLRDVGLDKPCMRLATQGDCMLHTRWCYSMAGREYARIYSWGNDPARQGDYASASPCRPVDLPQTLLEPTLVAHAARHGFKCRFDTEFVRFDDRGGDGGVLTTLFDRATQHTFQVRSQYLFGADGARSEVVRQLGLPLVKQPSQGLAFNVLVDADLTALVQHRMGNLHWILQPGAAHPDFAWIGIVRMVEPWRRWMFIMFPAPDAGTALATPTAAQCLGRVREWIGDDSIAVDVLDVSPWQINETVAASYASGNVFCLGDAVHRHPPMNGLGSNTCIQDAFNLAWKVAYVAQGRAGRALLDTFSAERQPVGAAVVARANDGLRDHHRVWEALGVLPGSAAEEADELAADSAAGRARRLRLQRAVAQTAREFHGLGVEMNQLYASPSAAVHTDGVGDDEDGDESADPVLHHVPSTFPGRRLPHVWLSAAVPAGLVSTIDLAGRGGFALFTGIGGEGWREAAAAVAAELGVPVRAVSIGPGQDFEDVYFAWARVRGVGESGCVLVRPDRFVAWRAGEMAGGREWALLKLRAALAAVLSR